MSLLDTGASRSLIVDRLVGDRSKIQASDINLFSVQGERLKVLGKIVMNVLIGGRTYEQELIIVPTLGIPAQLVLGCDFMNRYNFNIVGDSMTLTLNGKPINTKPTNTHHTINVVEIETGTPKLLKNNTYIVDGIVVAPYTYGSLKLAVRNTNNTCKLYIPGSINSDLFTLLEGVVSSYPSDDKQICYIYVPYVNFSSETVTLHEGQILGTVEDVREECFEKNELNARTEVIGNISDTKPKNRMKSLEDEVNKMFPGGSKENIALTRLVRKYPSVFSLDNESLRISQKFLVSVDTIDSQPVFKRPYPIPIKYRDQIRKQINNMVEEGIISPSDSPYNAPLIPILKKDKISLRLCLDFRSLNANVKQDQFPLPNINLILSQLNQAKYFTSLDLRQGYHQLMLTEDSKPKTAFSTNEGHYHYNVLPFGLKNAPAIFQRVINTVMTNLIGRNVHVFIDDILIVGTDFEDQIRNLEEVLVRLDRAQLQVRLSKCTFFKNQVKYLGHEVSCDGIRPLSDKISLIKDFKRPVTLKNLQAFLGLINYYRRFIKNFSLIVKPLTDLSRGHAGQKNSLVKLTWNEEAEKAFQDIKNIMSYQVCLAYPDFAKMFILQTDASAHSIGSVLLQEDFHGALRPLGFFSKKLSDTQKKYSAIEREALAVVESLKHYRPLILGFPVKVLSDHKPLKWLLGTKNPAGRVLRWQLLVGEYDIQLDYIKGKDNFVADTLSRLRQDEEFEVIGSVANNEGSHESRQDVIEWDLTEITKLQKSDKIWGPVIQYLTGAKVVLKNKIPCPLHQLHLIGHGQNSLLYRIVVNSYGKKLHQLIIPQKYWDASIRLAHSLPFAGHGGQKGTLDRLSSFAFFPGMGKLVRKFVRTCDSCLRFKPGKSYPAPLQVYPDVSRPFERVHVDLIGPLDVTHEGNRYILTIIDALTRYVITVPLPNKSAETVASALVNHAFLIHGPPISLFSDQGKEFVNETLKEICSYLKIKPHYITPYHPQANGLVERANSSIIRCLKPLTVDNPFIWDKLLPMATFAYNTAYHRTLRESPYFLLHHVDPLIPYKQIFSSSVVRYDFDSYRYFLATAASKIFNRVKLYLQFANKDIQERQTKKARMLPVKVGSRVYLRNVYKPGLSTKLQPLYIGPYRVIEQISRVVVKIRDIRDGQEKTVHTDRLKLIDEDNLRDIDNPNVRQPFPVNEDTDLTNLRDDVTKTSGEVLNTQLGYNYFSSDDEVESEVTEDKEEDSENIELHEIVGKLTADSEDMTRLTEGENVPTGDQRKVLGQESTRPKTVRKRKVHTVTKTYPLRSRLKKDSQFLNCIYEDWNSTSYIL